MKRLIAFIISLFFIGCGNENIKTSNNEVLTHECDATIGSVRDYNATNSSNRVNVFIAMGQSNSVGIPTDINTTIHNIYIPVESTRSYPDKITFKEYTNKGINKFNPDQQLINNATKFAEKYNDATPLYIIQIARSGTGITTEDRNYSGWNPYRLDDDGRGIHPQSIHYLEKVITGLQNEGLEPYVIGIDWNQWEAENQLLSSSQYFEIYSDFFEILSSVIPNSGYKLFLCKPTSISPTHTYKVSEAFGKLSKMRENTIIYDPAELSGSLWRDVLKLHYTEETHAAFAEFILNNI